MCWEHVPEPILLEIFMNLAIDEVYHASCVCKTWFRVAQDEFLWKKLFYLDFKIDANVQREPHSLTWKHEYKRLYYHSPKIESETLHEHSNQVLHVSFSHDGKYFASCSKDGFIKVWFAEAVPVQIKNSADMKAFSWSYTQFSQFNESDTLLLVSGVHFGSHTASGEIAVFLLEDFSLQCRVLNKPYDIFGTWYTDEYLISGRLHFLGHLLSCSALWLNKAYQENESEKKQIIKRLYKFYNKNASSIRTILVANCQVNEDVANASDDASSLNKPSTSNQGSNHPRDVRGNPISSQWPLASSSNTRLKSIQTPPAQENRIDYFGAQSNEACTMQSPIRYSAEYRQVQENYNDSSPIAIDEDSDTDNDFDDPPLPWDENWLKLSDDENDDFDGYIRKMTQQKAKILKNESTKQTKDCSSSVGSSDDESTAKSNSESEGKILDDREKLLIFTTGTLTYTPHQIGIKRIKPFKFQEFVKDTATLSQRLAEKRQQDELAAQQQQLGVSPNWQDEIAVANFFDSIDNIIELNGHIIGMGLSPDHRYLYVNSRPWPSDCIVDHPLHPPPIAQQIDIHVIDLKTLKKVGNMLRSHKAYTPNDECFFIFLDVSHEFVASGAEDKHGYLWDRHYGNCLAKLPHNDVVNSVAFNPKNSEMLVTASDDNTLKIWRSKNLVKMLQRNAN